MRIGDTRGRAARIRPGRIGIGFGIGIGIGIETDRIGEAAPRGTASDGRNADDRGAASGMGLRRRVGSRDPRVAEHHRGAVMGLTSALNTSLNGLVLNETSIDVLGNNIANAGTNGFKSSSVLFTTQLARTLSVGSRPTGDNAGTNPRQIGLGALVSAVTKDFTQGSITNSTSPSDLAIQGDGFFVLDGKDGIVYSRNGNFVMNSENILANSEGLRVQGYGVDSDFNLVTTQLDDIEIPVGNLIIAQETNNVSFNGALLSIGDAGTTGTQLLGEALTDVSGGTASVDPVGAATLLSSVYQDGSTTPLFTVGETLSFEGRKGGRSVEPNTLLVTAGTTLGDLMTLMDETLGIQSGGTIPTVPATPGVSVNAGGQIVIQGNYGTVNDLDVTVGDLTSNGATVPIAFIPQNPADGESASTDFIVYDSLGEAVVVKLTTVLESRTSSSTTFRWFLESGDDSSTDIALANGTIVFDGNGQLVSGGTSTFSIDRDLTAATSPLLVTADFTNISGISTAAAGSRLALATQDGSAPGTLTGFVIDDLGLIVGVFDNGITRTLGQVALARFANPQGLLEVGKTAYREGVGSGSPFVTTPGSFGAGTLRAGAIELSNTDIGRNLIDLIVASTNYRSNARVISSVQQLVDELLVLGR